MAARGPRGQGPGRSSGLVIGPVRLAGQRLDAQAELAHARSTACLAVASRVSLTTGYPGRRLLASRKR